MKEILFYILFISFLIYSSEFKIYDLSKYGKLIYNHTHLSLSVLNINDIKEEQIEIIYKIQKNMHDDYEKLYYCFINEYPSENDNDFTSEKSTKGIIDDSLENETKITYNIKKEEGQYLVLFNIICNEGEFIEVEHIKKENNKQNGNKRDNKGNTGLIVIIITSIIVVAGIIIGFIILGKYIYNKRQQEVMGNYASSFVEENSGIVPNDANNEKQEHINDENNKK